MAKREYESGTIEETYLRRENARTTSGFNDGSGGDKGDGFNWNDYFNGTN